VKDVYELINGAVEVWEGEGGVLMGDRRTLAAHVTLAVLEEFSEIIDGMHALQIHHLDQQQAGVAQLVASSQRMVEASEHWVDLLANLARGFEAHAERLAEALLLDDVSERVAVGAEYEAWKSQEMAVVGGAR
jgi:hypothetical protein